MGQLGQTEQIDSATSKAQLLDGLRDEQAQWEGLLQAIGEDHMTQPGVQGEWSVKDVIAHLTFWRRRTVGRLQASLRNEPKPSQLWPISMGTEEEIESRDESTAWDEVNAWIYNASKDRPLADVLRESREVFEQLVATIGAIPPADLLDPVRSPWLEGIELPLTGAMFFDHFHDEHEPDLRAWLEKVRQEDK